MYTLVNLRPYTEYSVYVTAVRLIGGDNGRSLEGMKSKLLIERTLAGGKYIGIARSIAIYIANV